MDWSRQEIVLALRRTGMNELAKAAEAELPDAVSQEAVDHFCAVHGLTRSMLMDRMGASPLRFAGYSGAGRDVRGGARFNWPPLVE